MGKRDYDPLCLVREGVRQQEGYKAARMERVFEDGVMLDANESPFSPYGYEGSRYNRYPEPQSERLLGKLSGVWGCRCDQVLLTRGSDEGIDLLCRVFCESGRDSVIIQPPTFDVYRLAASWQGARILETSDRDEDVLSELDRGGGSVKLIFLCTPNNPLGKVKKRSEVLDFVKKVSCRAIVVVDEAYIEFSEEESLVGEVENYPWLVVLRTLSKAWGLAGVRLGGLVCERRILEVMRKVQQMYPIPSPVEDVVLRTLSPMGIRLTRERIEFLKEERSRVVKELQGLEGVRFVYPSEANFLLVEHEERERALEKLLGSGIVVRDRHGAVKDCFRVSLGRREENDLMLHALGWKGEEEGEKEGRERYLFRETKETKIELRVHLDKSGPVLIKTGIGFFDHMLEQVALHGDFSLCVEAQGDLETGAHHLVEDCAIVLGQAIREALGDKRGICRYGFVTLMDDARTEMSLDLSGRGYFVLEGCYPDEMIGTYPSHLSGHFFRSFAENVRGALHVGVKGEDAHHMVESGFKALGRVLRQAMRVDGEALPSSKGVL